MNSTEGAIHYIHYHNGGAEEIQSKVITEAPVSLTINGEIWLTFMCTPDDLPAMAVGFLYNEGLIESYDEVASVDVCATGDNIDVWTEHLIEKPTMWRRTTGCTGGATSADVEKPVSVIQDGHSIDPATVGSLLDQLYGAQELYREVRGVHSSALSDGERIVIKAEDIGRHNTLDKIAGRMLQERLQLQSKILVTTGRVSSEMLQKAGRIGAAVVISRTSPSSLSIRLAQEMGITLIGYARRDQFNVYAHAERVEFAQASIPARSLNLIER